MINKNNNYEFLSFKRVLMLGSTELKRKNLNELLSDKVKGIDFNNNIMDIKELILYDLIIIDINYFKIDILNVIYSKYGLNIPIICITSKFDEKTMLVTKNNSVKNILIDELQIEQIYMYIKIALNERKKIQLEGHHSYCLESAKLFYKLQEIKLTKYESNLLNLLIFNKNTILTYKEIESQVWGEKKCSIYSMRNIVNKIRDKSFQSIIKNVSKTGYIFDSSEFY